MSVYREPPECTDDIYPGLSVWEERVSGSLTIKNSRLPLWAFVWTAITKGWEEADSHWGMSSYGYTADDLGQFLYYLFELRGEFARLIAVLADVERLEDDRNDDVSPYDYVPWPQDPELRGRVVDQLRRCLRALESTEVPLAVRRDGENPKAGDLGGSVMTRRTFRRLLGMVRLRLWSRGLARCNHCARMTRQEWETMCDCWLANVAWWRRFVR